MITVTKNEITYTINFLEHMLHHHNLENVFMNGLLSHKLAHERGLIQEDISMNEVQARRAQRRISIDETEYGLHEFVPFYFNSRNPMLYRRRNIQHELVVLCVDPEVINRRLTVFTDGNAANRPTQFYHGVNLLENVPFEITTSPSWNHEDENVKRENVRKMCAEVLAYPSVEINAIKKIACPNENMRQYVETLKRRIGATVSHISVELQTAYFFI